MRAHVLLGFFGFGSILGACSLQPSPSAAPPGGSGGSGASGAGSTSSAGGGGLTSLGGTAANAGGSQSFAGSSGNFGAAGVGGAAGAAGSGGGAAGSAGSTGSAGSGAITPMPLTGPGHVTITPSGSSYSLQRDGQAYYIKGINGQFEMDLAARSGANSTHTYNTANAGSVLDSAKNLGMTVTIGVDLDPNANYYDDNFKNGVRATVNDALSKYKDHPALLMWSVGNELNLSADNQQTWQFVGELANTIQQADPNHPVMTVLAGANHTAIDHVLAWASNIHLLGINSYAPITNVAADMASSNFSGPYVVTEWGPTGYWESPTTSWGRPLEQTSSDKAQVYQTRYEYIYAHRDHALGSYVFLWAQKQERTPTWFGMFLENLPDIGLAGESCPTVDVCTHEWSGAWPANRAPNVTALTINGKAADANVTLGSNGSITAQVTASDPEGDALHFVWEILNEPPTQSNNRGEDRPARIGNAQSTTSPSLSVSAPPNGGQYRLFVYALDGKGHAGTANVPFQVQ
jgi:hypothetical protein